MDWTVTPVDLVIMFTVVISNVVSHFGIKSVQDGQTALASKFDNGINKRLNKIEQNLSAINAGGSSGNTNDLNVNVAGGSQNQATGGPKNEIRNP